MNKLKTSIDENLKRRKIVKLGGKGKLKLISAPWVDKELIDNIKLRSKLNKNGGWLEKGKNQIESSKFTRKGT